MAVIGAIVGAFAGAGASVMMQLHNSNGNWSCLDWGQVAVWAGAGAVAGLVIGFTLPFILATPDAFVDLASMGVDLYMGDARGFALDALSLAIPGFTGAGALSHADEIYDALHAASNFDNYYDAVHFTNSVDNLYDTTHYGSGIAQSLPPACFNSFSADTEVSTKDGDTPISLIKIGDYVLAWDETTDTLGWYKVTDTIHHTDEVVIHLTIDGEELETTPEHPFYVEDEGWVDAEDLQVGDDIRNADGEIGEVEAIESEQISQEMYNLTVDEAHTFFVGDGQWLVHNTIWCDNYEEYYDVARDLNYQVHHILPRRFESVFENTNIDIHDARWLREVQSNPALGNYHQYFYTNKWQAWADNLGRTPTPSEVVNYARTLEKKYLQEYGTAFYRAGSNMPGLVDWKTLIRLLR